MRRNESVKNGLGLLAACLSAFALIGATMPETRFIVTLPTTLADDAHGHLLLFAEPATPANADSDSVDTEVGDGTATWAASRDVASFATARSVTIDTQENAFPRGFAAIPPGVYRVQAVLDRNNDYAYAGRGPGDLASKVVTIRFPLTSAPSIPLDHAMPPQRAQFDTTGIPPVAAEQIAASRPHLHEERIPSALLTRFRGEHQEIAAWVLTPPGYDPKAKATYPTVYTGGGFGTEHRLEGQRLSQIWHLMETHTIAPMIWVALSYGTPTGPTGFADSVNNGPWGRALVTEVIPALERRYRMDAKPSGRFLTGHSSGGWFAAWVMVRYPALFGGSWPTSPDPVDFHATLQTDLYSPDANVFHDHAGVPRTYQRDHDKVIVTVEAAAQLEGVLGRDGGQLRGLEWVFSPRRVDGTPAPLFDRVSGAVDPEVAAYWRNHYDIAHRVETQWPRLSRYLDGKLHVTVGSEDSYNLQDAVHRLEAVFRSVGGRAQFTYVPGATHSFNEVYTRNGDRLALYKEMTTAMYAIARPGQKSW